MKRFLILVIAVISANVKAAVDCKTQSTEYAPKVESISPKLAKQIIETGEIDLQPELRDLDMATDQVIIDALKLGLNLLKPGSQSLIYDLDALIAMNNRSRDLERFLNIKNNKVLSKKYERTLPQVRKALKVVEVFRKLERQQEVQRLENYISYTLSRMEKGNHPQLVFEKNARTLWEINKRISPIGKFKTPQASVEMCHLILKTDSSSSF